MLNSFTEKPNAKPVPESGSAGTILNGRYLAPPEDKDGRRWIRTSALIQASPEDLYRRWRDVESAPSWQEQISQVTGTGETTSHWIMGFGDKTFQWDSEVLADEPGKRIAWRSIAGDSDNAGEVIFESSPGGHGTIVTVLQEFKLGRFANAWETLVGRNPKQAVIENLRHFKALAETGEIPRTQGQPHGPRGSIGGMKKSMFGETIETPPGNDLKAS
jgi:uncharacterized membrane protein